MKSDSLFLDVMDETLEQIFKRVGAQVIFAFFEKNYQLKREEIVKNPNMFSAGLEKLLGSAVVVVERHIVKNLHRKIGLDYLEAKNFQFSNSVDELRWKISLIEEKGDEDSRKQESKPCKYLAGEFTSKPQIEKGKIVGESGIVRDVTERKKTEERMGKLNRCFLSFKADPDENINSIVALCGEFLGSTCALYNRLDQGMLCSVGRWNAPPDYNPVDKPTGHICYDVIQQGANDVTVIRHLSGTSYAKTDPNVMRYKLQTYVGKAVRFGQSYVGSLCGVFQGDFIPTVEDKEIIGLLASAIGVEEKRRQALLQVRDSEEKFRVISASAMDAIVLVDDQGKVSYWNPAAQRIFGYTAEEACGREVFNLVIPRRSRKDVRAAVEKLKTRENDLVRNSIEFTAKKKDGKEFPVELSLSF